MAILTEALSQSNASLSECQTALQTQLTAQSKEREHFLYRIKVLQDANRRSLAQARARSFHLVQRLTELEQQHLQTQLELNTFHELNLNNNENLDNEQEGEGNAHVIELVNKLRNMENALKHVKHERDTYHGKLQHFQKIEEKDQDDEELLELRSQVGELSRQFDLMAEENVAKSLKIEDQWTQISSLQVQLQQANQTPNPGSAGPTPTTKTATEEKLSGYITPPQTRPSLLPKQADLLALDSDPATVMELGDMREMEGQVVKLQKQVAELWVDREERDEKDKEQQSDLRLLEHELAESERRASTVLADNRQMADTITDLRAELEEKEWKLSQERDRTASVSQRLILAQEELVATQVVQSPYINPQIPLSPLPSC